MLLGSDGIAVDGGRMAAKVSVGCVKSVAARVLLCKTGWWAALLHVHDPPAHDDGRPVRN